MYPFIKYCPNGNKSIMVVNVVIKSIIRLHKGYKMIPILLILIISLSACSDITYVTQPPPPQSTDQTVIKPSVPPPTMVEYLKTLPKTYEVNENINQFSRIRPQGKYVVVNIPAFELVAYENDKELFRSKVIVGKSSTRTPKITTNITRIKFNPDWTPTPNMISNAIAHNKKVPKYTRPGDKNPLGLLKFELDNNMDIYLHDTDKHSLFNKDIRGYSHGCIRVEKYVDLAAWALNTKPAEIQSIINSSKTTYRTTDIIPVYIIYMTYWKNESGNIVHLSDI